MADFTVGCVDMKSNHGFDAAEMRITLLSIVADLCLAALIPIEEAPR